MAIFVFGYAVCWRTINSPFGQVLKALRENEPRAVSLGYNVDNFKLLAFVLSAALAGLAGATKALVFVSATLSDRSEEHTSELQSLMRISYAVFCLNKNKN